MVKVNKAKFRIREYLASLMQNLKLFLQEKLLLFIMDPMYIMF